MQPKRTGVTGLSNNELLILDFLAMLGKTNTINLDHENYPIHLNTTYSHDLHGQELLLVLDELENKGMISKEPYSLVNNGTGEVDPTVYQYFITKNGGAKWADERTPIWSKYCSDSTNAEGNRVEFRCVDENIGKQFAEIALRSKLYEFPFEELSVVLLPPGSLFFWIEFDQEFSWDAPMLNNDDAGEQEVNWDYYQANRCWWSTLEELQTFILK